MSPPLRALRAPVLLGLVALLGARLPGIAGAVALYPALGVFPGMALAMLVGWNESPARRRLLGVALSPLGSALCGWALMSAGVPLPAASRAIAVAGWILWVALEAARARQPAPEAEPSEPEPRLLRGWSLGLAAAVAIPPLLNPFCRVHGDGWVHAGLVYEIALRGFPPQDPRFAGLPLNYVWFYNLFVAQLTSFRDHDPFAFMMIVNVVVAALIVRVAYRAAFAVWRDRNAATGSALLLTLGFNAGMYLLWPLRLVNAFTGRVQGADEVARLIEHTHPFDDRVFFMLGAPFAHEVSFLDKFLLGTPLSYAWLLILVYLDSLMRWIGSGRRAALAWGLLATMGLELFHFVPGLSVIPVTLGALALTWLLRRRWPWLPTPGRLAAFGAATLLGVALVLPYTLSITRGWRAEPSGAPEPHFHLGFRMLWTLLTSCALTLALARQPLRRLLSERRAEGVTLAAFLAGMTLFAVVVHLTEDNESKFAFQVFIPLALFGGPAFLPTIGGWFRRHGALRAGILVTVLFLNHLLLLNGFLIDPRWRTAPELAASPGDLRLYRWIRDSTAARAIFVDRGHRDFIMVRGRRRLYYGSVFGPERAGFPSSQVKERRAVMGDLYGPGRDLHGDAGALARFGGPALVLFRPGEDQPVHPPDADAAPETPAAPESPPWRNLERRPDLFHPVYDRDGFRVYEVAR